MQFTIEEPCPQAGCQHNARILQVLKHRQMQKHSEESRKWRNSAAYYRSKCLKLEAILLEHGIDCATSLKNFNETQNESEASNVPSLDQEISNKQDSSDINNASHSQSGSISEPPIQ